MNYRTSTHLRGERGQAFANQIRNVALEQIVCVSIDISKYFHLVMIHNALGEIMTPTFEIDIFRSGFEHLCQAIDSAIAQSQAQVVLVGMEPTSHYFENLARHLHQRPQPVTLINSYAVSQNRQQQMMRRQKTDPIDVAAIGDLLRRGEGTLFRPVEGIYLELQHLARARLAKVKLRTTIKNQIVGHIDRIFPGLILLGDTAKKRYTPLFAIDFWRCQTLQCLVRVCPDPRQLAHMSPKTLRQLFHTRQIRLGPQTAHKIIAYAQKVLWPDPQLVAIRSELLQHDLLLLEAVEGQIQALETRLQTLLSQTPYHIWTKIKGLSHTQAASLAAAIGDPDHYRHAKQVFRRSGLISGRHDSGTRQHQGKGQPIIKAGDVYLRRALVNATETLLFHQPVLHLYYNQLKLNKPEMVARIATARRVTGILWAILRDQHSKTLLFNRGAFMPES